MKILFTGGGSMGPVAPLIAVMRRMKERRSDLEFAWAGTEGGPERRVVEAESVPFFVVPVAKFPQYPSFDWIVWPWKYAIAQREAARILEKTKPRLVVSVGGFSGVPIIRRAARRHHIPCAIHQLDVLPGLSNRAVAKLARLVTTTFSYDIPPFSGVKTEQVSTPSRFARAFVPPIADARQSFGLDSSKQTVFITGGGTGSQALNEAVDALLSTLLKDTQIIHLTGAGKLESRTPVPGYVVRDFFDEGEMLRAYAAADLVISRAGIGAMADLASLSKAAIFVPIPNNQQEKNVARVPCAAVRQGENFSTRLLARIREFLRDENIRQDFGQKLHDALPTDDGSALAERWLGLI